MLVRPVDRGRGRQEAVKRINGAGLSHVGVLFSRLRGPRSMAVRACCSMMRETWRIILASSAGTSIEIVEKEV
jgi:hypothetical protein